MTKKQKIFWRIFGAALLNRLRSFVIATGIFAGLVSIIFFLTWVGDTYGPWIFLLTVAGIAAIAGTSLMISSAWLEAKKKISLY